MRWENDVDGTYRVVSHSGAVLARGFGSATEAGLWIVEMTFCPPTNGR